MKWLFAVSFMLWQAVRGLGEAIVMHYPNPRDHPLFAAYHQIRLVEYAMLCTACYCVFGGNLQLRRICHNWRTIADYTTLAGLSVAAWELFELSYMWGRVGQATAHENIMGLFSLDGSGVLYVHAARVLIGAALIIGGRK